MTIAIAMLISLVARADDTATLTTSDFRTQQVTVTSFDETGGVKVAILPNNEARVVPMDSFLELHWNAVAAPPADKAGTFVVRGAGGEVVRGEPTAIANEQLTWQSPSVGEVMLPVRQVLSISRVAQPIPSSDEPPKEDIVSLANGDSVRGIVTAFGGGKVSVQTGGDAGASDVPLTSVNYILFASAGGAGTRPASVQRSFQLTLADGSVIVAKTLALGADGKWNLTMTSGATRTVDAASVAGVAQINGPVSWLSQRTPSENIQTPMLETSWPARMDENVTGDPIRFGDRTYDRGIGMHSYSRLVFPLDAGANAYRTFRTQYAIDGDRRYADVVVRIKLDDKVVHEKKDFHAGVLSPVISLELGSAKTLTLEVDYGNAYDVQDRFNWIEPALVKASTAPPPPTTQPH